MPLLLFFGFLAAVALGVVGAMITHIVVCIKTGAWILLVIGAFIPPIGVIHGFGHWFGAF